jgi:OmcA/MtrC family decaheme c-type cytochrome
MNRRNYSVSGLILTATIGLFAMVLSGCSGDDGAAGAPGAPGASAVVSPSEATALSIQVTGAAVSSPPTVTFKVTNQNGVGVVGFAPGDFRFNIAKLISSTPSSKWQNYIYRATGGVYGDQERFGSSGRVFGTLVDNKDGTYTYTFATDITKAVNNADPTAPNCPAPCTDADGNALDLSYQPSLTHRIGVQMSNSAYPYVNATYDFVPNGGVGAAREIVATANCNQCHNQLRIHGSRIETKLCVTCHNPGSWVAAAPAAVPPQPARPVDFKVMIHKIHWGEELPSVKLGTPYKIGNSDFSDVVFPDMTIALGDTRNCTQCHTAGAATPQGDNWMANPSRAVCGSCHDDVNFTAVADPSKPVLHPGQPQADDSQCATSTCHGTGSQYLSVAEVHSLRPKMAAEVARYKLVINTFTAAAGATPSANFTIQRDGVAVDFTDTVTNPEFAAAAGGALTMVVAWNNEPAINGTPRLDFSNNPSASATSPASPISINLYTAGNVVAGAAGSFDVNFGATVVPVGATGIARAGLYGRANKVIQAGPVANWTAHNINMKSVVKDYKISGTPSARRTVVDVAKCDTCHGQVSAHGGQRADEPGLCVTCHNPNATDISRRNAALTGETGETGIDFKRLIHAIHGSSIRTNPLIVWGYPGAGVSQGGLDCTAAPWVCRHDFSDVRFPGIIRDCATCHTGTTYALGGDWDLPTQNGILASTASILGNVLVSDPSITDPSDDRNISPSTAVCSSCHDSDLALAHMNQIGGATFSALQSAIDVGTLEQCAICHGPGTVADVKVVHGVK